LKDIGGLLAILKVGILLTWIHEYRFKKNVEKNLQNKVEKLEFKNLTAIISVESQLEVIKDQKD
jgi:hypothetical protein